MPPVTGYTQWRLIRTTVLSPDWTMTPGSKILAPGGFEIQGVGKMINPTWYRNSKTGESAVKNPGIAALYVVTPIVNAQQSGTGTNRPQLAPPPRAGYQPVPPGTPPRQWGVPSPSTPQQQPIPPGYPPGYPQQGYPYQFPYPQFPYPPMGGFPPIFQQPQPQPDPTYWYYYQVYLEWMRSQQWAY